MSSRRLQLERAYRLAEHDHLAACGVPFDEIARRVGIKSESLRTSLHRRARLVAQDERDVRPLLVAAGLLAR